MQPVEMSLEIGVLLLLQQLGSRVFVQLAGFDQPL